MWLLLLWAVVSVARGLQAVIVPGTSAASRALAKALEAALASKALVAAPSSEATHVFDCGASREEVSSAFVACVNDDLALWTRVVFGETPAADYLYESPALRLCSVAVGDCYGPDAPHPWLDDALLRDRDAAQGGADDDDAAQKRLFHHVDDVAAALASLVGGEGPDAGEELRVPGHDVTRREILDAVAGRAKKKKASGVWEKTPWPGLARAVLDDVAPGGDYALAFATRHHIDQPDVDDDATAMDDFDDDAAAAPVLAAAAAATLADEPKAAPSGEDETPEEEEATDARPAYDGQTVAQLKDILRSRGLKVSGKKAALIQRLQDTDGAS